MRLFFYFLGAKNVCASRKMLFAYHIKLGIHLHCNDDKGTVEEVAKFRCLWTMIKIQQKKKSAQDCDYAHWGYNP